MATTPEIGPAWVEALPVSRFHGVWPVTADKMKRLGIETGADLRAKSFEFLQQHFGSSAGWYHAISRGQDDRPVNPDRVRMADEVWNWCESRGAFGRTVTVKIKYGDFRQITRSRSQPVAVATQDDLRRSALDLVRSVLPPAKGIRLVGVTVSNFVEPPIAQEAELPMFRQGEAA